MTQHANSIAAFRDLDTSERAAAILAVYRGSARGLTDRQVMEALCFTEMNAVRPRITELIDHGLLCEVGKIRDHLTGKTVRQCTNTTLA